MESILYSRADLADMQLFSKYNKEICSLLCYLHFNLRFSFKTQNMYHY